MYSGANERNASFSARYTTFADRLGEAEQAILYDAQTSGGLLMAVPASKADACLAALHAAGVTAATRIGRIRAIDTGHVTVS